MNKTKKERVSSPESFGSEYPQGEEPSHISQQMLHPILSVAERGSRGRGVLVT
jgi:hypothetical protein